MAWADIAKNKKKLAALTIPRDVYSLDNAVPGYTYETWGPREDREASTKEGFELQWGGPSVNGIPGHSSGAAADTTGVESDVRFAVSERGVDDHRLCYWFHNTRSVPIEIQDTDARAESLRVYASCDCPANLIHERYQTEDGSPYHSKGVKFLTIPPGGLIKATVLIHDPGPDFSGFNPIANEVGSEETFAPTSYQGRPSVSCREIDYPLCDTPEPLAENESYKPIPLECFDCGSTAEGLTIEQVTEALGPHPEQRICTGPFIGCSGRSPWLTAGNTWSPVFQNEAVPQTDTEWTQVGNEVTGPDCVHDCHATADLGVGYALLRRIRMYISLDVRLLMNGVQVDLENDDESWFEDERNDTNPDVIPPLRYLRESFGTANLCAFNAPPGAVWTIEVRHGYRAVSPQSSSYFRYIGGLRSEGSFVWTPRDIVIGRV